MFKYLTVLMIAMAACGGGGDDPVDAAATIDAEVVAMAVTSATVTEGGTFPIQHTCDGDNISPALTWSNAPAATQGFAVTLTDTSIGLVHSVIWDIPASVSSLAENIPNVAEPSAPAGSKQSLAFDNNTRGYLGPCPPSLHHYRFNVFAIGEYPLSGVTLDSSGSDVKEALVAAALASASLGSSYGD